MGSSLDNINIKQLMKYIISKRIDFLYNDCIMSIQNTGCVLYEDTIKWKFSIFSNNHSSYTWMLSINELYNMINTDHHIILAWKNAFLAKLSP